MEPGPGDRFDGPRPPWSGPPGAWGQYLFVAPELAPVTVIASPGPQSSYAPRPCFTDYVLAAYGG